MATTRLTKRISALNTHHKSHGSITVRQPFFTLKRPLIFQVRKSLVEYVDEELLKMGTSVFYQRIFILAKNVDPLRESAFINTPTPVPTPGALKRLSAATPLSNVEGDTATLRTAEVMLGEDDAHYSQASTPDINQPKGEDDRPLVKIVDPLESQPETVTRTFNFNWDDDSQQEPELEETEHEQEPDAATGPKDAYTLLTEKLQELQRKCRYLSYTPDPMCGLLVYMNDYTMLMLESGEDMMGIFCTELLACAGEFWQSNRVFMIEDPIKELYTKELLFRRIPAAFLNEKFPPSTPTDEYLMGKQHLIIKEKMHTICGLIKESQEPRQTTEASQGDSIIAVDPSSDAEMNPDVSDDGHLTRMSTQSKRTTPNSAAAAATALAPDVFRRLLPEIQRIELVLASTRFYYTLSEFVDLYGKVPFGRDDDGLYWPIQNNYAPPNIFRRTPFDINLTFADYAAEMSRRMQEEQQKAKEEMEAAAAAETAAEQAQGQVGQVAQSRPHASQAKEPEEE